MPVPVDQLLLENIRLRDLLGRFVSLTQDDIIAYEGLAPNGQPDHCWLSRGAMQEARLALGMDIWIPALASRGRTRRNSAKFASGKYSSRSTAQAGQKNGDYDSSRRSGQ